MKKFKLRHLTAGATVALAVGVFAAWAANPKTYSPTQYDTVKISQKSGSYVDAIFWNAVTNTGPCQVTAPTVSGFGTNAAVSKSMPNCTAKIAVGSTASVNGTIVLPAATDGWACSATDITTASNVVASVKEISTTTNTAVIESFDANSAASNFVANDTVLAQCSPY